MSHIPASAMPHAQSHEGHDEHGGKPPEQQAQGSIKEQVSAAVGHASDAAGKVAGDAGHSVADASKAVKEAAGHAGQAVAHASGAVAEKAKSLPTAAKIIGGVAVAGAIAALAVPFLLPDDDQPAAKRKKPTKSKKASA